MLNQVFTMMILIIILLIFYDLQSIKKFLRTLKEEEK